MKQKSRALVLFFLSALMVFSIVDPSLSNAKAGEGKEVMIMIKVETDDGYKIGFGTPIVSSKLDLNSTKKLEGNIESVGENTIEQNIILDSSLSDFTVEVPLELQNGEYIVVGKDEQGNSDGATMIYNEKNESIGVLTAPVLGNDKNFKIVSVKEKNGDTLEFKIESDDSGESTNMLIGLAATNYASYFTTGGWIYRGTELSLRLTYKPYLISGSTNDRIVKLADSWNKVVAKHKGSSNWKNQAGLSDQYACHYGYANKENPWHIEPWRPNVGITKTILAGCNPK